MSRAPGVNGLIVVAVIALVVGVAWYKSPHRYEAANVEATAATPKPQDASPLSQNGTASSPRRDTPVAAEHETATSAPPGTAEPAQADTVPPIKPDDAQPEPPNAKQAPPRGIATTRPARLDELCPDPPPRPGAAPTTSAPSDSPAPKALAGKLPRVVDLGADKCKACKELAPILVELRKEYAGRVTVDFIDVWKDSKAGEPYKIRVIPTQIFFDREGKEVWRHEGFLPKADFIAKFRELGVK